MKLRNHVAIISGGMGDIGRAIAWELARQGSHVAISDMVSAGEASAFIKKLSALRIKARYDRVDTSSSTTVKSWIKKVESNLGTPNLIIPNAAIFNLGEIKTVHPKAWAKEININLNGAFYLAQAGALNLLKRKRPGRIVFIGSWAGHAPHPNIPAYCAAKAGLRMLCQCMALEFASHDILVNEVAPGYVDAGLSGKIFKKYPARRRKAIQSVPVKRLIQAEEVALQVAYLCDPANRHMTGTTLLMDGGLSLLRG